MNGICTRSALSALSLPYPHARADPRLAGLFRPPAGPGPMMNAGSGHGMGSPVTIRRRDWGGSMADRRRRAGCAMKGPGDVRRVAVGFFRDGTRVFQVQPGRRASSAIRGLGHGRGGGGWRWTAAGRFRPARFDTQRRGAGRGAAVAVGGGSDRNGAAGLDRAGSGRGHRVTGQGSTPNASGSFFGCFGGVSATLLATPRYLIRRLRFLPIPSPPLGARSWPDRFPGGRAARPGPRQVGFGAGFESPIPGPRRRARAARTQTGCPVRGCW